MSTWHQAPEVLNYHWFVSIEAVAASRFPQGLCVSSVKDELNGDRFRRSRAQIGNVHINTHASACSTAGLVQEGRKDWGIGELEFKFIIPDDRSNGAE